MNVEIRQNNTSRIYDIIYPLFVKNSFKASMTVHFENVYYTDSAKQVPCYMRTLDIRPVNERMSEIVCI